MTVSSDTATSKPLTGRRLAVYIIAGFAIILTANITLAVFAVGSWSGLLARNGYVASQDFGKLLAKARRQAARGWTSRFTAIDGNLRFAVSDADGTPVTGLKLRLRMGRPVHERDDFEVPLIAAPGGYIATAKLAPGQWRAQIYSVDDQLAYKRDFRLSIAAPGG